MSVENVVSLRTPTDVEAMPWAEDVREMYASFTRHPGMRNGVSPERHQIILGRIANHLDVTVDQLPKLPPDARDADIILLPRN